MRSRAGEGGALSLADALDEAAPRNGHDPGVRCERLASAPQTGAAASRRRQPTQCGCGARVCRPTQAPRDVSRFRTLANTRGAFCGASSDHCMTVVLVLLAVAGGGDGAAVAVATPAGILRHICSTRSRNEVDMCAAFFGGALSACRWLPHDVGVRTAPSLRDVMARPSRVCRRCAWQ